MKKLLVLLCALVCMFSFIACDSGSSSSSSGGTGDCTYDPPESESAVSSIRMFYPCGIANMSNLPSTTLTSGMGGSKEGMYWLARPMAAAGIVVGCASARDNQTVGGYEDCHKGTFNILKAENARTGSQVRGKIASYGIAGYSKGGGGSINAASALGSQVKSDIAMAPWGSAPRTTHTAPTLILVGTSDAIAPPNMSDSAYAGLPGSIQKMLVKLPGESHFYWNGNTNEGPATALMIAWVKYHQSGDQGSLATINNPGSAFSSVQCANISGGCTGSSSSSSSGGCN